MANKLKHLSSATAGNTPPAGAGVDRGRIAFNSTDRKLWGYDASGTARLIASLTTDHSSSSAYRIGDLAVQGGVLYRCVNNIPPKSFTASDWAAVSDFRGELLYRAPTNIAQARMTMGGATIGMRLRAHASQSAALTAWEDSAGSIVSDIRADGYPGAAFARPVFRVDQVAHGFTAVGQPARFNGTNWVLADGTVSGGEAIAVVHRVISANAVEIQTTGRIDGLQAGAFEGGTIAANTRYYLSVANPGQLTSTPPPNPEDENVVLHTITATSATINLQVPVGGGGGGGGSTLNITQSPNPFTAVGQVAAVGPDGWVLADAGNETLAPVGIIAATSGNDFAVALSGEVVDIAAGAAQTFPLAAGMVYYSTAAGLLTSTPSVESALGAGPVLVATSGSSGVVIAGQATPNALRSSQNLADIGNVATAVSNLGLNDVVRESRQINTGTGLTGGGNLTANRTLALTAASITSLGLADTAVQPARAINTGTGLTGGGNLSANRTISLTGQALALHNFTNTGFILRTGDATYTTRAFAAGDGLSVTNGSGLSGNPTYAVDNTVVRTSLTLTAGDGLSGGGNLGANRTFAVDGTVVRTSQITQSATDTTAGRLIRTQDGYVKGSILGTVSESGGVPTGSIIQRGSNSNGQFVRHADGTQICWAEFTETSGVNTANGQIFNSAEDLTWTFPAVFASTEVIVCGSTSRGDRTGGVAMRGRTATDATYRVWYATTLPSGGNSAPRLIAIGRWF